MTKSTRMLRSAGLAVALFSGFAATGTAQAETAMGVRVSTQGIGGELSYGFANSLAIRGGLNFYNMDFNSSKSGIRYNADFKFRSGNLFLDFYPVGMPMRFSAGLVYDKNKIGISAIDQPSFTVGGQTYTSADVGTLSGSIRFKRPTPYVGMGFGNPYTGLKIGITLEVGAYLMDPEARLNSTGGVLSNDPLFLTELEAERKQLQKTVGKLPIWPVIGLTGTYRF